MSNFTPFGLYQFKLLFGDGRMNFNIFLLKIEKLSEFFRLLSSLFHSITMNGKCEYLKENMPNIELWNVAIVSCSVCTSNGGGYY